MQILDLEETKDSVGWIKNNASEGKLLEDYTDLLASCEYWIKKLSDTGEIASEEE